MSSLERELPTIGAIRHPHRFCGRCGRSPEPNERPRPTRVCPRCGMGLLLSAAAELAPTRDDSFLVVDGALTIRAVSECAEELLGIAETDAVNQHILDYVVPADVQGAGPENLGFVLSRAAAGDPAVREVVVRPRDELGVRLWARVGACGPPTAALLVLATAG